MRRLRAQIVGFLTLIVPDYVPVPMCMCVCVIWIVKRAHGINT